MPAVKGFISLNESCSFRLELYYYNKYSSIRHFLSLKPVGKVYSMVSIMTLSYTFSSNITILIEIFFYPLSIPGFLPLEISAILMTPF